MTFQGRSEVVPIRTQRVPQTIETPVSFVSAPGAYVRYAYSRSSDSMNSQVEGQDYLCFKHNDQRLVFVVCDGVGQSFCGNLAARILGDNLLDWLWSLDVTYLGGAPALAEAATSYLNRIQKQAQLEVAEYQIPTEMSGLVRQALEAQRTYGSEAIFAAARIDHPSAMIPEGLISICWMGDTQIHAFDLQGQPFVLGGQWSNANRWSTAQGTKGTMATWMSELENVSRVVSFTDGLTAHATKLFDYGDTKLDKEIHAGAKLPTSDDVAFIDVVLRTPTYEGYVDPELPDPNEERPHLEPVWNPTGAPTYEVRWNWSGSDKDRFILQEATNPALSNARQIEINTTGSSWKPTIPQTPGHYYYRIRAIKRHGSMTPWSELRQSRVASPPPPAPKLQINGDKSPVVAWTEEGDAADYVLEQSITSSFDEPETVYSGRGTSWSLPMNVKPGLLYFRVHAISDGGPSPWSNIAEIEITVPPPPRPHLAAGRYGHAYGPYELRWQAVPGAVRYELRQYETERSEEILTSINDTQHIVPDLDSGHYIFSVRACNAYVCSEWSNEQQVVIAPKAPEATPDLQMIGPDEQGRVHLEWHPVSRAAEYMLEFSNEPDFQNARLHTQTDTSYDLQRREPGTLYIRVCATNPGGDGPWSSAASIAIAPDSPGWLDAKATPTGDRLTLAWSAVAGRAVYVIEMAKDDTPDFIEVYRGPDTAYEIEAPQDAESVRFRIRSIVPGAESAWWTGESLSLRAAPPAPVLEPPHVDERSTIHLRWKPVEGALHYILEASQDENFTDAQAAAPTDDTEVNFHPPSSGRWFFRIKSANRTRVGKPGAPLLVNVQRPSPPSLWPIDAVKANQPFEVAWKGMPGTVYYELQVSVDPAFPPHLTQTSRIFHPAQKLATAGQPAGKVYLRVRAIDGQNQASIWSKDLLVEVKS